MRSRIKTGSVVQDKRDKAWRFYWWENGKRRSKVLGRFATKTAAWKAAKPLRDALEDQPTPINVPNVPTVGALVELYRIEKMPKRVDTRRSYEVWIRNHILPKWGDCSLSELRPQPVELWLASLDLSPKSRVLVRGVIGMLWDFAMWRGDVAIQRNPMQLVAVPGASKRTRQPRSLKVEEFHKFIQHLDEPFRTLALVSVCCGLRISEALALRWSDVNWLEGRLRIERGIVAGNVDDVKTEGSRRALYISREVIHVLTAWKMCSQFSAESDWIFASPVTLGRKPWSYDHVRRAYEKAASAAGIGKFGTHTMRHSYRSWLDAVGSSLAVQQRLMRHSSITTTMNVYGDIVTDEAAEASAKVAGLALNGTETARKAR